MHIAGSEPDILILTEVIPKAQVRPISPALLAVPGYATYTNFDHNLPRLGPSGTRGVAIHIRDTIKATELKVPGFTGIEHLWVKLKLRGSDCLTIGCIYRSPSSSDQDSIANLNGLFQTVRGLHSSHLLIAGDFNLPQIDWNAKLSSAPTSHVSHRFLEMLNDNFLFQHVDKPTRFRPNFTPSVLDLIITNEPDMVTSLAYLPGLGASDHLILHFTFRCYTPEFKTQQAKLNFYRANYPQLRQLIHEADWDDLRVLQIDQAYTLFLEKLGDIIEECIPYASAKKTQNKLYMTREAFNLKKKKKQAWSDYRNSTSRLQRQLLFARHSVVSNKLRALTRKLLYRHEDNLVNRLKYTVKPFWRHVNTRLKTKSRVEDLKDTHGRIYSTDTEKATLLNNYFSSVFTVEDLNSIPPFEERFRGPPLRDIEITPNLVQKQLRSLKPDGSPGPDKLHPRVLREAAAELSKPLAIIFRKSIDTGELPQVWKQGSVVPIFKKGCRQTPGNYRPISLTSVACRALEALIRDKLMFHMLSNNLFSASQHGFRPGRSCDTQLLEVIEDWTKHLEDSQSVDSVYLDFRKAFDSVPHARLISKLRGYGIQGNLLTWIQSFLTNREQRVAINGAASGWAPVVSGVPQGSVLGPILFLIYINDLPDVVSTQSKIFADDTKIYAPVGRSVASAELQRDIDRVTQWSVSWQLPFNEEKCTVLHLGANNGHHRYTMKQATLQGSTVEKDLGVRVDTELKFREQAAQAATKGNQILALIRKSFRKVDRTTLPVLYKTLVRPLLEYGNLAWGPFNRQDQNMLERVQRRATRMVPRIQHKTYSERLSDLKLPSLFYRRKRGDMIRVYQILHKSLDIDADLFFTVDRNTRTRGHPLKLLKPRAQSRTRCNAFGVRIINDWNSLPSQVVCAPSTGAFKSRLDAHWSDYWYTTSETA